MAKALINNKRFCYCPLCGKYIERGEPIRFTTQERASWAGGMELFLAPTHPFGECSAPSPSSL